MEWHEGTATFFLERMDGLVYSNLSSHYTTGAVGDCLLGHQTVDSTKLKD